jgi:pSer/pThr/pTyr-binding forkhead associated (FHA) protein
VLVKSNDLLQIGAHHFVFVLAKQNDAFTAQDDPLTRHTWRSTHDLQAEISQPIPLIDHARESMPNTPSPLGQAETILDVDNAPSPRSDQTAQLDKAVPLQPLDLSAALLVLDGERAGHKIFLEHPLMTVGRGGDCDIVINEVSISRQHAQFLRQTNGVYVQDLSSCNGSKVNGEPLLSPRLLKSGDILSFGNINMEYTLVQSDKAIYSVSASTSPVLPPLPRITGGPLLLKLPSKPKSL